MNKLHLAIIVLVMASLACGKSRPTGKSANDYVFQYGGNVAVYENILSLKDCDALQKEFDTASENNQRETAGTPQFKATLGYMTAADNRMKELNCYGSTSGKVIETVAYTAFIPQTGPTVSIVYSTSTFLPTLTKPPTSIPSLTSMPTNTVVFIPPTSSPKPTVVFIAPTSAASNGVCSCSGNIYNCSDFSSHASAQACFNYCVQQGVGDIHQLDRDHDGSACESL